jgi:hypothetical protein
VRLGVGFVLLGAGAARVPAGAEHGSGQGGLVVGPVGEHLTRRRADVGAVEIGGDAAPRLGQHVATEARVGAGDARLRAVEAGVDARSEIPGRLTGGRQRGQHPLGERHHVPPGLGECTESPSLLRAGSLTTPDRQRRSRLRDEASSITFVTSQPTAVSLSGFVGQPVGRRPLLVVTLPAGLVDPGHQPPQRGYHDPSGDGAVEVQLHAGSRQPPHS